MTWQEVVKNDSIADKVLKNMVRIFYEKARLDDKIKRIRIDRDNSTITLIVFPKMTSLFLGRGNKTLNALEERLKRWKVNIEE